MSHLIHYLIENAEDVLLFIDQFDENETVGSIKVFVPRYNHFFEMFDERMTVKKFKKSLQKLVEKV